jgi:hypothetical protein
MADVDNIVFHLSTTNTVGTQGKFGLFTPYYYEVTKTGKDVHVRLNFTAYPVGIGAIVEWVLNPTGAKKREQSHITAISERNYQEELDRREQEIAWTHAANDSDQRQYARDVEEYNREMQRQASIPSSEECSSCRGKGFWGRNMNKCSSCSGRGWREVKKTPPRLPTTPMPRPIPTYPHVTVADFTMGLNRFELRNGHYVEGRDDPQGSSAKKGRSRIDSD